MGTAAQDEEYRLHQKPAKPKPALPNCWKVFTCLGRDGGGRGGGWNWHITDPHSSWSSELRQIQSKSANIPYAWKPKKDNTSHKETVDTRGLEIYPICLEYTFTPCQKTKYQTILDYRQDQDWREVNKVDIHPSMPNPYTLLSMLPPPPPNRN